MRSRSLTIGLALGVLVTSAASAGADEPTKAQCVTANETGASLRHDGKLRDARTQFLACVAKSCPGPVRDDCDEQLRAVEADLPSLTIHVAARGGAPTTVAVKIDGIPISEWGPNKPIFVEVGDHIVEGAADGYSPARVTVRATSKLHDTITLELEPHAPTAATHEIPAPPIADGSDLRRPAMYGLAGAGVVATVIGAYFGLHSKSLYDDTLAASCPRGIKECDSTGVRGIDHAHTEATVSTVAFVLAAGFIAGAAVLFATTPSANTALRRRYPGVWEW